MKDNSIEDEKALELLKELSMQDFLSVGMDQVAYIRCLEDDNFSVHAADGSQISVMDSYDTAVATIRVNDLYPVTVH
jgi:hypothetical protein